MKQAVISVLLMAMAGALWAQDPEFTQFHSAPLYLNPSFAGGEGCSRVVLNYRNQWPRISGNFTTYNLSYDQYVRPLRGGVGFYSLYDNAGQGTIQTFANFLLYAFKWKIGEKLNLSPSVKFGYVHKEINWDRINFSDMTDDPRYGFVFSVPMQQQGPVDYVDVGFGLLANTKKLLAGFAVDHATQPVQAYAIPSTRVPTKYTVHLAYDFQKSEDADFTFTPAVLYQRQQDFTQLNLNTSFRFKWLLWSIAYRNKDSFIFGLGAQTKKFRLGYSFDLTFSKLTDAVAGSHEVSLRFLFNCKNKKEHIIPVGSIAF